jgi:NAD(P)-dependent dehydrogenase (short-subunit alcohol dehydrogenase family)
VELGGRTAVVTGASRGLGAGIARELRRQGLRLALCARGAPALPEGEDVLAARLDVTDGAAVAEFAARAAGRFGRIDLWINNAGVLEPIAPLRDVAPAEFRRHLDVNVTGVFHGTQAFVRHVRARGGEGVLVNVSSGAARHAYAGWSAYCAAKAAVDLLTECVALEERESGLRAYAVAPGVVDTAMQEQIRACTPARFPAVEQFRERKREGRFNTPAFVAREILALAFDPARRPEGVLVRLPDEAP